MNKTAIKIAIFLELVLIGASAYLIRLYENTTIRNLEKNTKASIMEVYPEYDRGYGDMDVHYCDYNTNYYVINNDTKEILKKIDSLSQEKIDKHNEEVGGPYKDWGNSYEEYCILANTLKVFESYVKESESLTKDEEYVKFREKMGKVDPKLVTTKEGYYYVKLQRKYIKDVNMFGGDMAEYNTMINNSSFFNVYVTDVTTEYECIAKIKKLIIFTVLVLSVFIILCSMVVGRKMEQNVIVQRKFFENTSHELKTPLASIKGYAEAMRAGVMTNDEKNGEIIIKQVDKLSKLVEEIMCIAKLESGVMKLHKEVVDASEFIQDCIVPFEGAVKSHNLDIDLALEDVDINIDVDQFEHAFTNLFTNSLKYAKSTIKVRNNRRHIEIWNDCKEIPDEDIKHIFDRFYTGKNGNTGIGLALAKDIIDFHGFKIEAKKQDDGICFAISV